VGLLTLRASATEQTFALRRGRAPIFRAAVLAIVALAAAGLPNPQVARTEAGGSSPVPVTLQAGQHRVFDLRRLPPLRLQPAGLRRDDIEERHAPRTTVKPGGANAPVGSGVADSALAPAPDATSFDGLHYAEMCTGGQCGDGHPPDTNGDVGAGYYIQTINTAIGVYDKSSGTRIAAFTFNNFMSQGSFGNLCDTDNFGDPVVIYDSFRDRWVITDFAFQVDSLGNIVNPPGSYQCFAVSRTDNPVTGGWNFYSLHITDALQDYPKFGVWPDGLYMSANMFGFPANGSFKNVRVWAFNLTQMEAGAQVVQSVSFNAPKQLQGVSVFSLLPSNARVQAGVPPAGRPNYFASVWGWTNRVRVWKFHVDWANTANATFTGPTDSTTATSWASPPSEVPEKDGHDLDTLPIRLMMQNQYVKVGAAESLWNSHTVRGATSSQAAVRWYQVPVTGGTIGSATQASTWNPDTLNRFMPSLAVDRLGNMALGYSVTDGSMYPAVRYAGRLASDPVNTLGQTEQTLIQGTGGQTHNFSDGSADHRWGDYSAMTLDPDGCTFWYTNEYYVANGGDHHTRIGHFVYAGCSPLSATVPSAPSGVNATAASASAVVSWLAPANGGSLISGYSVASSPGGHSCTTSGGTSCSVTGLTNGTSYTFTVQATNSVGTGPASAPSNAVVPTSGATVPGAPQNVVAGAGNALANVSWDAPASDGGSAITGYTVTSAPGAKTCSWTSGALACTVTGLTNGTSYTFTVKATNGVGTGPPSAASNPVIPATVPGAPLNVQAVAADQQASVSWDPPSSTGGSAITGYTVTSTPGAKTCSAPQPGPLDCSVTGLTNGTSYTFTVQATNSVGTGPASAPSNAVTPTVPLDTVPPSVSAPQVQLVVGDQLGTSSVPIHVSWSATDASGISSYRLQQKRNSGSWKTISLPSPTTTEVTLLRPPGYTYRYRVRATDGVGNTSANVVGPATKLLLKQEKSTAISYAGTWKRVSVTGAYGGYVKYATSSSARARFTFTGRFVGWVAPRASNRGVADVYIDGVYVSSVDLYSPTETQRRVVFSASWSVSGSHSIEIRVNGTADRPRIDIDCFAVGQ
jgi:hypothetical protein